MESSQRLGSEVMENMGLYCKNLHHALLFFSLVFICPTKFDITVFMWPPLLNVHVSEISINVSEGSPFQYRTKVKNPLEGMNIQRNPLE